MTLSTSRFQSFVFSEKEGRVAAMMSIAAGSVALSVVGAAPAHAQIYNSGLTTSSGNSTIYFNSSGVSSYTSFIGYQYLLTQTTGNTPTMAATSNNGFQYTIGSSSCAATDFTAGSAVPSSASNIAFTTGTTSMALTSVGGWTYPGEGYLGLETITTGGTFYGWADVSLASNNAITLNNFAFQTTAGAPILAGAAPAAASAPEPDAVALLALGASGLAAYRLRRKVSAGDK